MSQPSVTCDRAHSSVSTTINHYRWVMSRVTGVTARCDMWQSTLVSVYNNQSLQVRHVTCHRCHSQVWHVTEHTRQCLRQSVITGESCHVSQVSQPGVTSDRAHSSDLLLTFTATHSIHSRCILRCIQYMKDMMFHDVTQFNDIFHSRREFDQKLANSSECFRISLACLTNKTSENGC